MFMTKRIIAVLLAVLIVATLMSACSGNSNNANTGDSDKGEAATEAVKEADSASTGDNSTAVFSMTLFDVEYIVGHSRVKDLTDNNWGYDAESWKEIDMDKKIEYKEKGGYSLKLDNNTTDLKISYENLAQTYAKPEECVISEMEFKGTPDGTIGKAGLKILGGKVDLTKCTSFDEIDNSLKAVLSDYEKEQLYDSEYSASYTYKAELPAGRLSIYANFDKKDNKMGDIDVTLDLNSEFVYSEDGSVTSASTEQSGEKTSSVYMGKTDSMWDDGLKLSTEGDSSKLAPSITLFDKVYTVGATTLKQMTGDGWGYDTEDWKEVNMDAKVEYKRAYSDKTLHNKTAEIEVDIANFADIFAKPEDCFVTQIKISGSPDGVFTKAGVKLCDKIDLSKCTTKKELEDALKSAASWVERHDISTRSVAYHFLAEDGNGNIVLYVSVDDEGKINNVNVELTINDKYTYGK